MLKLETGRLPDRHKMTLNGLANNLKVGFQGSTTSTSVSVLSNFGMSSLLVYHSLINNVRLNCQLV
jgi:hypothetical protein